MKCHWLMLGFTLILAQPSAPLDRAHFIELNQKAHELSQQQNWKGLREALLEIGRELSSPTPQYFLRMAAVESRLGNQQEALRWLAKYAALGLKYDLSKDEAFKQWAPIPRAARALMEAAKPIHKTELVCTLPLLDLMPEDITFDHAAGTFVVSSIQHHRLYRVITPKAGTACSLQEIPLEEQATRWPVLAVSADATRNLLWMTSCAMPGFTGFPKQDEGKAALFAVESASGKIVRRFDLTASGPAVLGDMSVSRDGTVYVSDSIGGGVYRVRGDLSTAKLEKIGGDFFSPQTPVLAHDGSRLFVADYSLGIAVIDLNAPATPGRLNYLPHPDDIAVTGLDGLYLAGDSLIGIQNGTEPERIVRYRLNPAQSRILSAEVVEQSTERLGDPTHVTEVDGWLYVSANVGWNKVDDSGQLKPGEHFTEPALLRFR